ncbi:MAG: VOC family protein [Micromonosporaceae bacterium]
MTRIDMLCPRLVVEDADAAIAFYTKALGADERERHDDGAGHIVHAELRLGDHVIMVKDADEWDQAPTQLGGTPVILYLGVADVDAVAARMSDAGATVVFPVGDMEYGRRDARLRDPYGHLWLLSQPLR